MRKLIRYIRGLSQIMNDTRMTLPYCFASGKRSEFIVTMDNLRLRSYYQSFEVLLSKSRIS